jgi:hypothetical protein
LKAINSNYNSLQTLLRTSNWHGLTIQATYTWSHALDYETGLVPYLPQDSTNVKVEYGNSDFDIRNTFSGYVNYLIPGGKLGPKRLTHGWELNGLLSFHGGQPFSVVAGSNSNGNGENADRASLASGIANPLRRLTRHRQRHSPMFQSGRPLSIQLPARTAHSAATSSTILASPMSIFLFSRTPQ